MSLPVLWQLRLSHYNEKARWALDHKRVPHVRRTALPAFHVATAMRLNRQQTMPILIIDGRTVGDSEEIVEVLEKRNPEPALYPDDVAERGRALELERFLDTELGPHVRRIYLFHMLAERPTELRDVYTIPAGRLATATYDAMFGATKSAMRRTMNIEPDAVERSGARVVAALERIEDELGGGEYLVGSRFGIADLTAASLLFPVLRPAEYQYAYPPTSPGLEAFREDLANRPAFAWLQGIWRRHRGESAEVPA